MKVVFLDFDGVINVFSNLSIDGRFSKVCCQHVNSLLKEFDDLKIVVSSSWRLSGLNEVRKILNLNGIDPERVIDITGDEKGDRGHQIQCWLDRNSGVESFVIIDDESDMGELITKLVKTNSFIGITSSDVKKAASILKQL